MNKNCINQLSSYLELQNINDIIEITYAYQEVGKGNFFNKTIFEEFAGISREVWQEKNYSYYTIHTIVKRKLESIKKGLDDFKDQKKYNKIDQDYKKIVEKSIVYMQKIIDLTIACIPFEIEKVGFIIPLSSKEREQNITMLKKLEKTLFGGECKNRANELNAAYIFLIKHGIKNKKRINNKQFKTYINLINKIKELPKFSLSEKQIKKKIERKTTIGLFEQKKYKKLFNTKIARKDYIDIFKLVLKIYNIEKPIVIDERSSIYDGSKALYIPQDERYNYLPLKRVIALIAHEIETHYLIEKNHRKVLNTLRGGRNLGKEEGLAIIHEWLINEKKLKDFTISTSIGFSVMAEIHNEKNLEKFLTLYYKLGKKNVKHAKMRMLRLKRNYPIKGIGCQHKDVTYSRGTKEVIKYLQKGASYEDLYINKVEVKDISISKKITKKENIKIQYPLFIAERIKHDIMRKKNINFTKNLKKTFTFLEKKYFSTKGKLQQKQKNDINKIINIINKNLN